VGFRPVSGEAVFSEGEGGEETSIQQCGSITVLVRKEGGREKQTSRAMARVRPFLEAQKWKMEKEK